MRLRAKQRHRFYHRSSRTLYMFSEGEEKELPDELAHMLLAAHPDKFEMAGGDEVEGSSEERVVVASVEEAPQDGMVRRGRRSVRQAHDAGARNQGQGVSN